VVWFIEIIININQEIFSMSECKCNNPECTGDPCLCEEECNCDCKKKEEENDT